MLFSRVTTCGCISDSLSTVEISLLTCPSGRRRTLNILPFLLKPIFGEIICFNYYSHRDSILLNILYNVIVGNSKK